jgi:hypothetical protein
METFLFEKNGRKRAAIEVACDSCNIPFLKRKDWVADKNYCSTKCRSTASRTQYDVSCSTCNNTFQKRPSAAKKSKSGLLFCSRTCKDVAQKLGSGITGFHPEHYGTGTGINRYREEAFKVFPQKCMVCSFFDEYPELMQVHHIDANRNNNDISNLAVLCPTHHWAITIKLATMGPDRIWKWVGYK